MEKKYLEFAFQAKQTTECLMFVLSYARLEDPSKPPAIE